MKSRTLNLFVILTVCIGCSHFQKGKQSKTDARSASISQIRSHASAKILTSFPRDKQPALNLCWAAVTANVSKFYEPSSIYRVCDLANIAFAENDCCGNIGPCDQSWYLDRALKYTKNFKEMDPGVPSLEVIENQITNDHVICLRIQWRGTNCGGTLCGHFIIIYGFSIDDKLYIYDPWPTSNPPVSSLAEIRSFYQNVGEITHYYLTKSATE